jgi:hypothetical protein
VLGEYQDGTPIARALDVDTVLRSHGLESMNASYETALCAYIDEVKCGTVC